MAVTITDTALASAIRLGTSDEETAEVRRLLAFATEATRRHLGDAFGGTPDVVVNEAVVRLAAWLFDQPQAGRASDFANAMRSSGAARMLLPYVVHRAGALRATTAAEAATDAYKCVALLATQTFRRAVAQGEVNTPLLETDHTRLTLGDPQAGVFVGTMDAKHWLALPTLPPPGVNCIIVGVSDAPAAPPFAITLFMWLYGSRAFSFDVAQETSYVTASVLPAARDCVSLALLAGAGVIPADLTVTWSYGRAS